MFADDAGVADLLVAERQLVMREADGARFVRKLGVLQSANVKSDGARLLAAGEGDSSVEPPQGRKLRVGDLVAQRVRRPAQRGCSLNQVILKQPGLGQRGAGQQFVFPVYRAGPDDWQENLRGFRTAAPFQRGGCPRDCGVNGLQSHAQSIQSIHPAGRYNPRLCRSRPMALPTRAAAKPTRTRCSSMSSWAFLSWRTAWVDTTRAKWRRRLPSASSAISSPPRLRAPSMRWPTGSRSPTIRCSRHPAGLNTPAWGRP